MLKTFFFAEKTAFSGMNNNECVTNCQMHSFVCPKKQRSLCIITTFALYNDKKYVKIANCNFVLMSV